MRSKHDPALTIEDIIENAEHVEEYVAGLDFAGFERDRRTRDAVERCIERVCEAAHRLADDADLLMPGHPWADIRGMGNQLRHGYDRVVLKIVWNIATVRLPLLLIDARAALAQLDARGT